jgi:preprotein translocase SecF subunit
MLLAGIIAMVMNVKAGKDWLNLGIDFKGGGLLSYRVEGELPSDQHAVIIHEIRNDLKANALESEVQISSGGSYAPGQSMGDSIIVRLLLKDIPEAKWNEYLEGKPGASGEGSEGMIKKVITPTVSNVLAKHNAKLRLMPDFGKDADGNITTTTMVQKPEAVDKVGSTVSTELINQGILAVVFGTILILFWIWIRYNIGGFSWRFAVAGIVALLHDLLTVVGMFAILHNFLQVNSPFIAALLTVLGFSIHDTIIIYDRIRENMRLRKGRTFAETVNISLLETMARSVNTVLTVLFTLLALFFFGGPTLRDFVAAMLIGIVIGAYSSIFVAGQLVVSWAKPQDKLMPAQDGTMEPAAVAVAPTTTITALPVPATPAVAPTLPTAPDKDAIKRARQAGKTSKRKK